MDYPGEQAAVNPASSASHTTEPSMFMTRIEDPDAQVPTTRSWNGLSCTAARTGAVWHKRTSTRIPAATPKDVLNMAFLSLLFSAAETRPHTSCRTGGTSGPHVRLLPDRRDALAGAGWAGDAQLQRWRSNNRAGILVSGMESKRRSSRLAASIETQAEGALDPSRFSAGAPTPAAALRCSDSVR